MLKDVYARYAGGTMMLLRREGEEVAFLGTAFLVHPEGYLITVAHILYSHEDLMVAPRDFGLEFGPMLSETVAPYRAEVVQVDKDHDLALLRFHRDFEIVMPDHVVGVPDLTPPGARTGLLGYPFGFHHIYNLCIQPAVVSAKVLSGNETRLFLVDAVAHEGARGGPLVSIDDGRVIGVVGGRLDPAEVVPSGERAQEPGYASMSFAISIEYAARLLEAAGLEVV
jgi:serine protease Do